MDDRDPASPPSGNKLTLLEQIFELTILEKIKGEAPRDADSMGLWDNGSALLAVQVIGKVIPETKTLKRVLYLFTDPRGHQWLRLVQMKKEKPSTPEEPSKARKVWKW